MATIKNIRQLKNAGVLAERKAATPSLELKRYTLFYGFNGAGKSTLSRLFSSLQHGAKHDRLPENCTFEIELDDGTKLSAPKNLTGLEKQVCVFNQDFIAENLRWDSGAANPIFYIGADQAEAAELLKSKETTLPTAKAVRDGEAKVVAEREKSFSEFKRLRARDVSERLRQAARYEAQQLVADFKVGATDADKLSDADLDAASTTSQRSDAPAKVAPIEVPINGLLAAFRTAHELAPKTMGGVIVADLETYPDMVPWVRQGHDFHVNHDLKNCLHCGEEIPKARRDLLASAFDDKLATFITAVGTAVDGAFETTQQLDVAIAAIPAAAQLSAEFQPTFEAAASALSAALADGRPLLAAAAKALGDRKTRPTTPNTPELPVLEELEARMDHLAKMRDAANAVIKQHAAMVDDFNQHQQAARGAIRRHFVAINRGAFENHQISIAVAVKKHDEAAAAVDTLEGEIKALRMKVQEHGKAAEKINALVRSYLGHGELTIVAVEEGYELHRHGAIVTGPPSEGEKTAIALCYFLSTLEAEDRKLKDLIVVIDDPVSSLDTKAMNYACSLVRNRLDKAAQVIVFTHNQHCLNEFRKHWKSKARATPPTGRLLFLDVTLPEATKARTSTIIELPKQLREYDSEYHFLFQKVLQFEQAGGAYFDYAFLMPNVLRRVLEVFLAFKVPRDGAYADKIATVCDRYKALDQDRLNALERLSQVESHSDNIDDLISQSSMTIEESRDANAALVYLMQTVDPDHLADLRKYCAP